MGKIIFKDLNPDSAKGPHPDYNKNLSNAKLFCGRVQKALPEGMAAKITDSDGLKEALLTISFIPPKAAKMGNFSAPISLHQPMNEVQKQTQSVFDNFKAMAQKFWNDKQKVAQPELLKMPKNDSGSQT